MAAGDEAIICLPPSVRLAIYTTQFTYFLQSIAFQRPLDASLSSP